MKVAVIDCGSSQTSGIERALIACGATPKRILLDDANSSPLRDFERLVISGGGQLVTEEKESFFNKFQFIASLSCPVLGICLGHQILAIRDGAKAFIGPEIHGPEKIRFSVKHPLFEGIESDSIFQESHKEWVTIPAHYKLLATSASCPVEAIAALDRPFFGVQFHPEISGEPGTTLFRNFLAIS